jgi:hypothetical protein
LGYGGRPRRPVCPCPRSASFFFLSASTFPPPSNLPSSHSYSVLTPPPGPSVADATWTPEMVWNTNFVDVYSANLAWLSVEKCVYIFFVESSLRFVFRAFFGEEIFSSVFKCFSSWGVGRGQLLLWSPGVQCEVQNGVRG